MKKISLALLMAVPLALGGVAIAQTTPNVQTSTPGAGCTATGNAMRAGNLGGGPSSTACGTQASANTAAAAPAPATATNASETSTSAAGSTGMRNSDAVAGSEPTRVARAPRADRN